MNQNEGTAGRSRLYEWAYASRVTNEQRRTPCAVTEAFLHSRGTVDFEMPTRGPLCLLHAQEPDAYRYEPGPRLENLLAQAAEVQAGWRRATDLHHGAPPTQAWERYDAAMHRLAERGVEILTDLRQALEVMREQCLTAADTQQPEIAQHYALMAGQLGDLLALESGTTRNVDDRD